MFGLRRVSEGVKLAKYAPVLALLLTLITGSIAVLPHCSVLAQEERVGLALSIVSGGYNPKVTADKDNVLFLEIRNTGNKALTNIRLSSVKPEGWIIDFKPSQLDYLSPQNFQTIDLNIKPGAKATEGRYEVTVIAESNEIRKVLSIRPKVEAPKGLWMWIGGIILLVVVVVFAIIFVRSSRH